jgi:hypothetical protein
VTAVPSSLADGDHTAAVSSRSRHVVDAPRSSARVVRADVSTLPKKSCAWDMPGRNGARIGSSSSVCEYTQPTTKDPRASARITPGSAVATATRARATSAPITRERNVRIRGSATRATVRPR